jgi:hypothetical protein
MNGVEIWFVSGLEAKQFVTKNALTLFDDCQGDVLCIGKGDT